MTRERTHTLRRLLLRRMMEDKKRLWQYGDFAAVDSPAVQAIREEWAPDPRAIGTVLRNLESETQIVRFYERIVKRLVHGRDGYRWREYVAAKGWRLDSWTRARDYDVPLREGNKSGKVPEESWVRPPQDERY